MKLDVLKKDVNIESTSEDSIDFAVDASMSALLYDILSQYSNPIGSIVRELTTNAYDSHLEAGINEMVTVRLIENNALANVQAAFEVEDYGVGLSPERVRTVYSRFLASTKRETNEQHGAFGLGSKSPFSYTDLFYCITRHDGIEYTYALHKGSSAPQIQLMDKEPTDKRNGTIIRINIKDGDIYKFRSEIQRQLAYFHNIEHVNTGVDNNYTIYSGEHFMYRTDASDLSLQYPHIALGKVYYPIDWSQLSHKYKKFQSRNTCFALKFEIGELPIIWSRENIEYTDEAIKTIENKLDAVADEVKEIWQEQQDTVTDMEEFFCMQANVKDSSIHIPVPGTDKHVTMYGVSDFMKLNLTHPEYKDLPNCPTFQQTVSLVYRTYRQVSRGVCKQYNNYSNWPYNFFEYKGDKISTRENYPMYMVKSKYDTTKNKYLYENKQLHNTFYLAQKLPSTQKPSEREILSTFGVEGAQNFSEVDDELVRDIKAYTLDAVKILRRLIPSYEDDVTVPKAYKEARKSNPRTDLFKPGSDDFDPNLKLHIKLVDVPNDKWSEPSFTVYEPRLQELIYKAGKGQTVIYGYQDHADLLAFIGYILCKSEVYSTHWNTSRGKAVNVFKIAKSKEDIITNIFENAIFVEDFMPQNQSPHKIMKRLMTYYYLGERLEKGEYPVQPSGLRKIASIFETVNEQGKADMFTNVANLLSSAVKHHNMYISYQIREKYAEMSTTYYDTDVVVFVEKAMRWLEKYPLIHDLATVKNLELSEASKIQLTALLKGQVNINPMLEKRLEERRKRLSQFNPELLERLQKYKSQKHNN